MSTAYAPSVALTEDIEVTLGILRVRCKELLQEVVPSDLKKAKHQPNPIRNGA